MDAYCLNFLSCVIYLLAYQLSFELTARQGNTVETEEQETKHFIVNFSQPQFNLHSEEANVSLISCQLKKIIYRAAHPLGDHNIQTLFFLLGLVFLAIWNLQFL